MLSILIQVVDPGGVTGPAISEEWVDSRTIRSDEDIRDTCLFSCISVLQFHAFLVHEVFLRHLDVWVENDSDASAGFLDLLVHLLDLWLSEVLLIESEILIATLGRVLLCPFDVRPDDVKRESVLSEVPVSLHEHLSRDVGPLAEMEAKSLDHWHWCITRDCCQVLVHLLHTIGVRVSAVVRAGEDEELKSTGFTGKGDRLIIDVDESVCRVHPEECRGSCFVKACHVWDTSI